MHQHNIEKEAMMTECCVKGDDNEHGEKNCRTLQLIRTARRTALVALAVSGFGFFDIFVGKQLWQNEASKREPIIVIFAL